MRRMDKKKRKTSFTADYIRDLLNYDPETGLFSWRVNRSTSTRIGDPAGNVTSWGYHVICVDYIKYMAHRLAWLHVYGHWPVLDIDHINGVRNDNRIINLRDVTPQINSQNLLRAMPSSKTKLLGCHMNRGRFTAQIRVNGKIMHLGRFDTPEPAHAAYLAAKRKLHEGCTI